MNIYKWLLSLFQTDQLRKVDPEPKPTVWTDPVLRFYAIKQATVDGDMAELDRLCTHLMALRLSNNADPGCSVLATFTEVKGVEIGEGAIVYTYRNTVRRMIIGELWLYKGGKLFGLDHLDMVSY